MMNFRTLMAVLLLLPCANSLAAPDTVRKMEAYIDIDPGVGNGTPFTFSTPKDSVSQSFTLSTPGSLKPGRHLLYVRTYADSAGVSGAWGLAHSQAFFVQDNILSGEYFIDTDPGIGNGTAFAITTPNDSIVQSLSITTPNSITPGRHYIYVRTKNFGQWSLTSREEFYVLPKINYAEYFFDTDPGLGNGTPLTVSPASDSISENYSIPTTGLSGGSHSLYVRSRSASGQWSLSARKDFFILQQIVSGEYFWDTDPGPGAGTPLPISLQKDSIAETYTLHAPCLSPGTHYLYVRMKDDRGNWGLAHEDTLIFANPNILATASYPGPGPYGTPVKVLGSGGAEPYQYKLINGSASRDSIFLVGNNTLASFIALDTCGYADTTTITTLAAPTLIAGDTTASGSVLLSGYRHWTYVLTTQGGIIAAVRDNGQNLGQLNLDFFKNRLGTVRTFPVSSQKYLDRNWNISSTQAPTAPVGLMLYAVDSEYNALKAADPLLVSKTDLKITKYDGANEDLDPTNNSGAYLKIVPDSVAAFIGPSSSGDGYALAFSVNNFSEFYEARNSIVALGIQDVQLGATVQNNAVQVQWHTTGEQASQMHHLQRSASGRDFEEIGQLAPGAGTANSYEFLDRQVPQGKTYYRVAIAMQDGSWWFSQVVSVLRDVQQSWAVFPNPARDYIQVSGLVPDQELQLRDGSGKLLWQGKSTATTIQISTHDLASGHYVLTSTLPDGSRQQQRIAIVR